MKPRFIKMTLIGVFCLGISSWNCADNPIEADLNHLSITIDTLSITEISGESYWVAPNLGSNEKLFLGTKNNMDVPISFIGISDHIYWDFYFDSTITFDSLHFILYSNDSLLSPTLTPNLYFQSDSQFSESKSTYLDFEGFSTADWTDLGQPNVKVNTDTSGIFTVTELVWNIMNLVETLTDTADTNLIRSFAIQFTNNDTNFIELFSREATNGPKDPKVKIYYHQTVEIDEDSTYRDTTDVTIYSFGDLSIIDPGDIDQESADLGLSNGLGLRSKMSMVYDSLTLLEGSLIREAKLSLPIDTTGIEESFTIIIDPIETALDTAGAVFETDPYTGIGYPYRVSSNIEEGVLTISIKSFLQNVTLGNETNFGFKVISDEKNDPFEMIRFDLNGNDKKPVLEIIYAVD